MIATTDIAQLCFHCGNECPDDHIHIEEKFFCCDGCKTVYEILDQNNLCNYYEIEKKAGNTPQISRFDFLDNPEIAKTLLDFQNENISKVTFYIPTIHCSSCLYLLENLFRLHEGIERSQVDFLKKQVAVTFNHNVAQHGISFRQLAELLSSVGYEPLMSLNDVVKEKQKPNDRKLLTQLGLAGFCAGNIMLFSFPEYLGLQDDTYKLLFGYLNIVLAIPVVFYSASSYFESVYKSLRKGIVNIDFPILLSILVAFFRGIYEVVFNHGAGYFDSLTGLIFFLLIGKWFQQKTYHFLSFERDYKSYFPLAVTRLVMGVQESVSVSALKKGDKILIRNGELIPADSLLYKGEARIDYSFVTGEAALEKKELGDFLFAGGRQVGGTIEMEVLKDVSQSYLTQLWNNDTFQKEQQSRIKVFSNLVGKYFTFGVLTLAFSVATYWYFQDSSKMLNAFSAILIIACPCTLSLSYPFALGNGLRILGKQHFYLKNGDVIETMANCDTIVFDKTGTITTSEGAKPHFQGKRPLSVFEEMLVVSLAHNSSHPISQKIKEISKEKQILAIEGFKETLGKGIEGKYHGHLVKLGSGNFVNPSLEKELNSFSASVAHLSIDDEYLGYFALPNHYRADIEKTIKNLGENYETYLLSGDNQHEKTHIESWFTSKEHLRFECSPHEKLSFILKLQSQGKKVIMIGDGLNDAGALKQADIGIAVTDDTLNFTPMSDGILSAEHLKDFPVFLKYSRFALKLIRFSYIFSLMYNCIGLTFAVQGTLSPIVAAILMPLNSITLVGIASIGMVFKGKSLFKEK
ncbi:MULTISPECIES: heavy metal translocating P-type ATPase metal-binding domain-containing protein [unclassified Arcicella]|uniref:heavy metal translocating P-type ATPase n=1 Tax=unclassified Arcicella TaxID=2644986 RepID=UPI00285D910B|nr:MULTISPECIES: heavy metal translocating P-type ATPase metal-binding domain-containing protein [unclassified Arcicella]MDR6560262.1 Cu+-exporting ATPase [Arcicella sp. BE51]MDR6810132.1 Cu+-exporting ATPase [Arcicella sp. BE140]MDR6821481.1 Cu+-exporting ATPase [Arcicella sp. BE139]